MRLGRPSTSHHLEPLIGQLVSQMRMAFLQYGFVSTYDSTVFVKRTADDYFLLLELIRYDAP
ncbi:hypothetical protein N7491_003401 [Penicillium cf. griseofulvum]|uniref:Uncharacterized protein n=1 Tax=Penicillium cf. griseofulvum TaxID=2972120 RepID=A0A9W9MR86_9EURO|nr:hypothetical protein N7472_002423 [Penicillium cf. griseofulvum]KAJ5440995.1 hypothetical protein N7491_003401 [Penicillium cf. griseofulvum]KAJ5449042.1 hypothetical protein N7445_003863 [Penicillium cf. griseofulvum]